MATSQISNCRVCGNEFTVEPRKRFFCSQLCQRRRNVAPIIDRLWRFISPEPNSGCWLWTGCLVTGGYGGLTVDKQIRLAHRLIYENFKGAIPKGLQIDHLCRVRCCVNPYHLEAVTLQENLRRGLGNAAAILASAELQKAKTHCPKGHPYSGDNLVVQRGKDRACRECNRAKCRDYQKRRRAHASSPLSQAQLLPCRS